MRLELKKFGTILSSRPAAKEAWLATRAYILNDVRPDQKIEIDFSGVAVLTPSWADEFISALKEKYPNQVILLPSDNKSVKLSLEFVR
ncbi:MAG: STAS-like domain-containing protein [Patescibacteria group bacterium]